ncbi:hypothetical protein B0H14DRAFT_3711937 [Mycena olivaceomarginata]|nr:hypothetical protein B0H14DRAFT_3711937 [Mycena olivaceomarginata]
MCWDAEPTQPSMTSLERCTIVPGCLHPQPHLSRRLWALFFLSPPTRPRRMIRSTHAQAPPAGSFDPPLTVTSPARLPYSSSSTTGTCSTCSVACEAKQQRWQVSHVDNLELRQQRCTTPSTHQWPTSWGILLAPQTIKDTQRAAGKKERSEVMRGPVEPREGYEDSSVCLRLPMVFHLARVHHRPAALSPALSATRSLLCTRLFFPNPNITRPPAHLPVGLRTHPDPARITADDGSWAAEKEGEGGRDGSCLDSSVWRNV